MNIVGDILRISALKEAHALLKEARDTLRRVEVVLESGDSELADEIEALVVNGLEGAMWRIESKVRSSKGASA